MDEVVTHRGGGGLRECCGVWLRRVPPPPRGSSGRSMFHLSHCRPGSAWTPRPPTSCGAPWPSPLPVTCQGLALEQQPLLAHGDVQLFGDQMFQCGHQLVLRHLAGPRVGTGVEPAGPAEGSSPGLPGVAGPPAASQPSAQPCARWGEGARALPGRAAGTPPRYLQAALAALERLHR